MPSTTRTERIAYGLALLRAAVLIALSLALMVAPERMMPGSSAEPARGLGLMFASRTLLLGVAFLVLALRRRAQPLAWVFFGDAALQLFDMAMAVATDELALAPAAVAIGALEVWAGRTLQRASTET